LASARFFRYYQLFKYTIYSLLALNVFIFLWDEWIASSHLFTQGVALYEIFQAFSATIDTGAWVVLLLLFEMETFVLPDEAIKRYKWPLHGVRAVCYIFIVSAFVGYYNKAMDLFDVQPISVASACELVNGERFYMTTLDEFEPLSQDNCETLNLQSGLVELSGTDVISDGDALSDARWLAWVDVINAGAWLLVVLVLEFDVWLQLREALKGPAFVFSTACKVLVYATLVGALIYWGWAGALIDTWDAFLWLVAFVFIEMNIITWREETAAEVGAEAAASARGSP